MKTKEVQLPGQYEFGSLDWISRQLANGFMSGYHKSPYYGFSVEFAEHRPYNPGESVRFIDWKVYARTEKLLIKKFEEETNLRCRILIDTSSSMYYPAGDRQYIHPDDPSKIHFSILAAAALIHLFKSQRDSFALTFFDENTHSHTIEGTSALHQRMCFEQLKNILTQPSLKKQRGTKLPEVLHQLSETSPKNSLLILFSDLILPDADSASNLYKAFNHLKFNKIQLLIFHTLHTKTEIDFDFELQTPILLIDAETGKEIKVSPAEAKSTYTGMMRKRIKELHTYCTNAGIDIHLADINLGYHQVLAEYLKKRARK